MQDRTEIDRPPFIRGDVLNISSSSAAIWVALLVAANALLGGAAALWGGDWRNLVPSACLGAVVGQQAACAIHVVFGHGSLAVRTMLQCLAVWLTAPVLAMSIRPHVAWADLQECLAALFICGTVLTTAFAAARWLRFQIRRLPSTASAPHAPWWFLCIWLAMAMSLRPRVTGLADVKERLTVLLHCALILTIALAAARLLVLRLRQPPTSASSSRPQWSLTTMFSITTFLCIWLGMAIAVDPSAQGFRYGPVRWGAMLAIDVLWIPALWAALAELHSPTKWLAAMPFLVAPIILLLTGSLDIGQAGDLFVQGWLGRPHQDNPALCFLPRSGFGACLTVAHVEVGVVTAFIAGRVKGSGAIKGVILLVPRLRPGNPLPAGSRLE